MHRAFNCLLFAFCLVHSLDGQSVARSAVPDSQYALAFASFAPLNTDIFVADADGRNPRPLLVTLNSTTTLRSLAMANGSCSLQRAVAPQIYIASILMAPA
jgi:hypothetical protein